MSENPRRRLWASRIGIDGPNRDNALTRARLLWHGICLNPGHERYRGNRDRHGWTFGAGPEPGSDEHCRQVPKRWMGGCAWRELLFAFSARRRELPLQLAIDAGFSEHGFTEPKRGRCGSGDSFRRRRARFGANYSRAIPGLHRQRGAGFAAKRFPTRRVAGQREDALPRWLSKRDSC